MANCLVIENVGKCAFFRNDEIIILNKTESDVIKKPTILRCPSICSSSETNNGNKKNNKSESKQNHILSADISSCGNLLVICDNNYRVILWKNENITWNIINTRHSARKCQKVIFSNLLSDIILADRGGDVFKFSSSELNNEGEFILGHISFITDICISSDDKYLATCDRDGKIRISNYPNCYNIHSYCLGHAMFISSGLFLKHYTLVSGSGDGSLRLWELDGVEKECQNVCQNITFDDADNICETFSFIEDSVKDDLSKESLQCSIQCCRIDVKRNLLVLVFHFLKGIALYNISDCKFQFKQFMTLSYRVKEVLFLENKNLLIVSKDVPIAFCELEFDAETDCYRLGSESEVSKFTKEVQKFYNGFENDLNFVEDEHMLFKKNYENDDQDEHKSKKNKI